MNPRDELERQARNIVAEVCQLYGLPSSLGAAWGVLFANPHPMSLTEIATAIGVAKSTASTTLKRLEYLRMVRRHSRPGDRSDYFEVRTDVEQILHEWLERFVKPELSMSGALHDSMRTTLQQASESGDLDDDETATLQARLTQLESTTSQMRAMVDAFLSRPVPKGE